jgi:hypothetical protein
MQRYLAHNWCSGVQLHIIVFSYPRSDLNQRLFPLISEDGFGDIRDPLDLHTSMDKFVFNE